MHILVLKGLVERPALLDTCNNMIGSIEVNGPCSMSDAVASFLADLIRRLQHESTRSAKDGAERVLAWLFRTWAPSKLGSGVFQETVLTRRQVVSVTEGLPLRSPILCRTIFSHLLMPV